MEEEKLKRAKKRARRLRKFYSGLIAYIVVNIILIIINLVTSPGSYWFYWVTIFWGIAIILDAVKTFAGVYDEEWEEKKAKEIMDKERKEGE